MGLSFTSIKDRPGSALYLIHNGTITQQRQMERLAQDILARYPSFQVLTLSARDSNGIAIQQFYSLSSSTCPHALIVDDNDQLLHVWSTTLPTLDHLAFSLSSTGLV